MPGTLTPRTLNSTHSPTLPARKASFSNVPKKTHSRKQSINGQSPSALPMAGQHLAPSPAFPATAAQSLRAFLKENNNPEGNDQLQ